MQYLNLVHLIPEVKTQKSTTQKHREYADQFTEIASWIQSIKQIIPNPSTIGSKFSDGDDLQR